MLELGCHWKVRSYSMMSIFSIISSVLVSYFSSIKTDKNNGVIKISSSY